MRVIILTRERSCYCQPCIACIRPGSSFFDTGLHNKFDNIRSFYKIKKYLMIELPNISKKNGSTVSTRGLIRHGKWVNSQKSGISFGPQTRTESSFATFRSKQKRQGCLKGIIHSNWSCVLKLLAFLGLQLIFHPLFFFLFCLEHNANEHRKFQQQ